MHYDVTTIWHQQRRVRGKSRQKVLTRDTETHEWPDGVAGAVASLLEDNPKLTLSGFEEFGQGGCHEDPISLRCKAYGDCRHHHIESVRAWVEKHVDELKAGESTDYTGGELKWVSVAVEAVEEPADEPADE